MITTKNYFTEINHIGVDNLPPALLKSHELVNKVTQNGASWETYNSSEPIKRMIDLYIGKLNELEAKKPASNKPAPAKKTKVANAKPAKKAKPEKPAKAKEEDGATPVEAIEDELKFIKRFVLLDGKSKSPEQILNFLNSLQKAIIERRIRKTSPYATEIKIIQEKLVQLYNNMSGSLTIHLKPETMKQMNALVKSEKVMPSVNFMKRYVRLQGKPDVREKVKKLLADMKKAVSKGILTKADKYSDRVNAMFKHMTEFMEDSDKHDALDISKHELNGLMGILQGCGCGLSGVDDDETDDAQIPVRTTKNEDRIMNSQDFVKLKFDTIGFTGKWKDFIGDPSKGFTAMVFGRPKMGKSYLCMEFAGYLARNHGKVLYVAKEEKLDATLQEKLKQLHVEHPNLDVVASLPHNLKGYDFIFIDSVNKMGLEPSDLDELKSANPNVSFIYVFQSTKSGAFRGSQHFQHDVDVVIEVPEIGQATQYGRFNQGGEMQIFN